MNPNYKKCPACGQLIGNDEHICPPVPREERFWKHVHKTDSCWLWTASVNDKGYGQLFVGVGKSPLRAHRVSWELHRGLIPIGLLVLHHCDNPPCVRPDHLFLGTYKDSTQDMISKGRQRGAAWQYQS